MLLALERLGWLHLMMKAEVVMVTQSSVYTVASTLPSRWLNSTSRCSLSLGGQWTEYLRPAPFICWKSNPKIMILGGGPVEGNYVLRAKLSGNPRELLPLFPSCEDAMRSWPKTTLIRTRPLWPLISDFQPPELQEVNNSPSSHQQPGHTQTMYRVQGLL
jgi:hypothetical protein